MARFPIPDEALRQHIAILGKTGSGKSNAAKTAVEILLARGERVCAIDPTGTWWGLRLRDDGKKPSPWPVVIFGGEHADLPLGPNHGAAVAEAIGTSSTPAVIDTRLMTVGERTRFFTAFAEALLRKNQGPLHLVIDEAHVFAPQGRVADPASGQMLHAANNLVSLGRGIGLRIILISQRPAKLHKDALTQVETLVAMRLIAPQDRRAIDDWIGEWADPAQGKELVASLPSMATGDAWIWAPEIGLLERAHFPLAATFDSGRPAGDRGAAPHLAPIDVDAIAAQLDTIAVEALANDPTRLRKRIAELERQVKAKGVDPAAITAAEARGAERERKALPAQIAAVERQVRDAIETEIMARVGSIEGVADGLVGLTKQLREEAKVLAMAVGRARRAAPIPASNASSTIERPAPPAKVAPRLAPPTPRAPSVPGDRPLTGPQTQLLKALAWWKAMGHDAPTRVQLAAIAGWKPKGSNLRNRLSELSSADLVTYRETGRVALTAAGEAAAPEPDTGMTLLESIRAVLTGPQLSLFDALVAVPGHGMTRADLAASVGWEPSGSNLRNRLSELSSLELVEYPSRGEVALQGWVTE
jgi:hypothetical protein